MRAVIAALLVAAVAGQTWTVLQNPPESMMLGIACGDENNCQIAGGDSSTGSQHMYTTDGGQTYELGGSTGTPMLMMDVAVSSATVGVTSGVSIGYTANQYTTDGQNWDSSLTGSLMVQCQSAANVQGVDGGFGLTGTFGKIAGVAVSTDGGLHFDSFSWNVDTDPRYGAFPSADTWYVVGGTWPDDSERDLTAEVPISQNLRVSPGAMKLLGARRRVAADNDTYQAAIAKTTDGGQTFVQQLFVENQYYFNQIDCATVDHCIAVGEGQGPVYNGAGIFVTTDGGNTWNQTAFYSGLSLMAVEMIDEQTAFVGGGEFDNDFVGRVFSTTDGGQTWTETQLKGLYVADLDFVTTSNGALVGYGVALTILQTSVLIKYE